MQAEEYRRTFGDAFVLTMLRGKDIILVEKNSKSKAFNMEFKKRYMEELLDILVEAEKIMA